MPTFTEANRHGDVVKREWEPLYNRETVTVASGQNLAVGAVVGRITSGGKYQALALSGSTGAQNAAGVLVHRGVDASAADAPGVVLARGPAVVSESALVWPAGATDPQKAAAIAQLVALGIVVRKTA
jgi:hypothetical protein